MTARKRNNNESFKAYRKALKAERGTVVGHMQGRVVWPSRDRGTYIRKKHGPIGSEKDRLRRSGQ